MIPGLVIELAMWSEALGAHWLPHLIVAIEYRLVDEARPGGAVGCRFQVRPWPLTADASKHWIDAVKDKWRQPGFAEPLI